MAIAGGYPYMVLREGVLHFRGFAADTHAMALTSPIPEAPPASSVV